MRAARIRRRLSGMPLALAPLLLACCTAPPKAAPYVPSDYTGWQRTTATVLDYPIPGHQDRLRIPRMNAIGFTVRSVPDGSKHRWDFPEGTVIVKEVFKTKTPAAGEGPVQLTIMVKAPKDERSQGGWLWITRNMPDGVESVFMGTFCITCHANANEVHPYADGNPLAEFRDYVFFVPGQTAPAP